MANIHLNRNRQAFGQFSPEEVAAGLQTGRFLPTDLAWTEGMESWKPLSEIPDLPAVEAAPPPILAPGDAWQTQPPAEIQPAWERRPSEPFFSALFQTIRDTLSQPAKVFSSLSPQGAVVAPLFFYVLVGTLTSLVSVIYQLVPALIDPSTLGKEFEGETPLPVAAILAMAVVFIAVMLPVFLTLGSFISAGILHLCLMLIGGANQSFAKTYQVSCYAHGSASVFQLVPICGGLIAGIYGIIVSIIGIKHAHGIETSRAAIAVLLPLVLCCGAIVGAIALAGAAGVGTGFLEELAKHSGR